MKKTSQLILTATLTIISVVAVGQNPVRVRLNNESGNLNSFMPKDFADRTFIKGLSMFRNTIEQLAGSLIILGDNEKAEVLGQYIKNGQPPIKNISLSDVLYSSKINEQYSANGSYMIASASASNNSIVELIVTDINGILVPEQSIPYLEICIAAKNVNNEIKKKMYYVRSVKVTSVHSKAFKEVSAEAAISGVVFSANGKVYNSSDQFKVDYVVSVDMVNLNNLLITKNCEDIITTNELAIRQLNEKTKLDADKAETNRKIKENELNAAKAEVVNLKNSLQLFQEALKQQKTNAQLYKSKTDSLSRILAVAESKVKKVSDEFVLSENQVIVMDSINNKLNTIDDKNKLIQKSSRLEIKELRQLTDEEIKKLGFKKIENN